jgi:RimJ/RimL family protein N-acetyltransferase
MEFDFDNKYLLEDNRAILKPLELSDFENLISFAVNEPEIWKYSLVQAIGENGLKNYLNLAIQGRIDKREYPFIVFDKLTESFAGSTRFYDVQIANKSLQLGYTWYGKQYQGTGLNKHCKNLLLEFAFERLGIERVEFRADSDNKRSILAMKSIGCVEEGILRSNGIRSDGTRRDSIILSILKSEWETKTRKELEKQIRKYASH